MEQQEMISNLFGKKNSKLVEAKEQRKIDKMNNKSERERIANKNREKNGGAGIKAAVIYADKTMPIATPTATKPKGKGTKVSAKAKTTPRRATKGKAPSNALNGKKR